MLLNPDKSEEMLIAPPSVAKTFADGSGVAVAGSHIPFSVKLKSLGVTLDKTLSFDEHVKNIVKASNFHIKALRHVRPLLDKSIANSVACSIVTTRLDYCNSLLYRTSKANLEKLQMIQNTLARVVAGTKRREHITPVLKDLHWLEGSTPSSNGSTTKLLSSLTSFSRRNSLPTSLTSYRNINRQEY